MIGSQTVYVTVAEKGKVKSRSGEWMFRQENLSSARRIEQQTSERQCQEGRSLGDICVRVCVCVCVVCVCVRVCPSLSLPLNEPLVVWSRPHGRVRCGVGGQVWNGSV